MIQAGYLTRAEAEVIGATEVVPVEGSADDGRPAGFAAYFVEEVRKQLEEDYGAARLYKDGLRVWTTLVPQLPASGWRRPWRPTCAPRRPSAATP